VVIAESKNLPSTEAQVRLGTPAGSQNESSAEGQIDGQGTQTLNLRQALATALKANRHMLAMKGRAESANINVSMARAALYPHAQLSAGITKIKNPNNSQETSTDYIDQKTKTYTLSLQQNLFDGLVRLNSISRAKLLKVRAEEDQRKSELDTIEAVQREYFKLIRTRADIKAFKASLDRLQNQREAAEAFFRVEMAPRLTVLQVETSLAQVQQRYSRAKSDEQIQLVKLSTLLGKSQHEQVDFSGDLQGFDYTFNLKLEDCVQQSRKKLPEAVIAEKDMQIAQEELTITQGKMLPRVDLSGSYIKSNTDYKSNTTADADRKYYTAGINVTWDAFSGGETLYEVKSREKLLHAAVEELAGVRLNVYAYVRESFLNVAEAQNQMRIALARKREAQEAHDQADMRFRSGIGTSMDLLDAQEKMTSAESAFNQAQAEFLTSQASLYRSMGEKDENLARLAGDAGRPQ
jgi:outer membrane protein TolC